jgi:hypothetical protein
MLLIVAADDDLTANRLAQRWADHSAVVVSPRSLSAPGWSFDPESPLSSTAVVEGRQVSTRSIRGVLTRLPAVTERDLTHIVVPDRAYVAAEMTAFLTCWLDTLACPVLNRPSASCLSGPGWWPVQWLHAGARLGMHVTRATVSDVVPDLTAGPWVTVVGDECATDIHPRLAAQAKALARAAEVELLSVQFSGSDSDAELLNASVWPDLEDPLEADLVLARLLEANR